MKSVKPDVIDPREPFAQEDWDPLLLWRFEESAPGTQVYFTSRPGGQSSAPYESLNLGFHVGDDPETVKGNRALLCSTLGLEPLDLTSPRQRHTDTVEVLEKEDVGSGATGEESAFDHFDPCDGLFTTLPGAPLLLHFADCVPVVLTARTGHGPAIAVIHAGRRGLMEGIVSKAASLLMAQTAAAADSITAAIGPCIGPCCYQVDDETEAAFAERFGSENVTGRFLDLRQAAVDELVAAGLRRENIYVLEICTACNDQFFSYRRDGVTGRHGAIAWIEP